MTLELKCGVVQGEERDPGLRLQQEFCFKDRLVRRGSQAPQPVGAEPVITSGHRMHVSSEVNNPAI